MPYRYSREIRKKILALISNDLDWMDNPEIVAKVQHYSKMLYGRFPIQPGNLADLTESQLTYFLDKGYPISQITGAYGITAHKLRELFPEARIPAVKSRNSERVN